MFLSFMFCAKHFIFPGSRVVFVSNKMKMMLAQVFNKAESIWTGAVIIHFTVLVYVIKMSFWQQ